MRAGRNRSGPLALLVVTLFFLLQADTAMAQGGPTPRFPGDPGATEPLPDPRNETEPIVEEEWSAVNGTVDDAVPEGDSQPVEETEETDGRANQSESPPVDPPDLPSAPTNAPKPPVPEPVVPQPPTLPGLPGLGEGEAGGPLENLRWLPDPNECGPTQGESTSKLDLEGAWTSNGIVAPGAVDESREPCPAPDPGGRPSSVSGNPVLPMRLPHYPGDSFWHELAAIGAAAALFRLLWLGFSRIGPDAALHHPRRSGILECVSRQPGIPMNRLRTQLGFTWVNTLHHVRVLQRAGHLKVHRVGRRTALFPTNAGFRGREDRVALLHRTTVARIHRLLVERPGLDQAALSAVLGLSQSRMSQCLGPMRTSGLVDVGSNGARRRYFAAAEAPIPHR